MGPDVAEGLAWTQPFGTDFSPWVYTNIQSARDSAGFATLTSASPKVQLSKYVNSGFSLGVDNFSIRPGGVAQLSAKENGWGWSALDIQWAVGQGLVPQVYRFRDSLSMSIVADSFARHGYAPVPDVPDAFVAGTAQARAQALAFFKAPVGDSVRVFRALHLLVLTREAQLLRNYPLKPDGSLAGDRTTRLLLEGVTGDPQFMLVQIGCAPLSGPGPFPATVVNRLHTTIALADVSPDVIHHSVIALYASSAQAKADKPLRVTMANDVGLHHVQAVVKGARIFYTFTSQNPDLFGSSWEGCPAPKVAGD